MKKYEKIYSVLIILSFDFLISWFEVHGVNRLCINKGIGFILKFYIIIIIFILKSKILVF